MSVVKSIPVDGFDVRQDMRVGWMRKFVDKLKPDQKAVNWCFVSLQQLEPIVRTLVDEMSLDGVHVQVRYTRTSKGTADDELLLVEDQAADVLPFLFLFYAFVNLDLTHIPHVDCRETVRVTFRIGSPFKGAIDCRFEPV